MSTLKKSPAKSTKFWTGISTVVLAGFAYFFITPDFDAAQTLGDEARIAVEAVNTKNYIALITVFVNIGNILFHLFKKNG